jgi:vitamin K-dependent gamma-carboxylase
VRPDPFHHFRQQLLTPADVASLCAARFLFGVVMSIAALRFLLKGWVSRVLVEPAFHFSYAPFLAVRPLPEWWMQCLFAWLVLCGMGIAFGAFYRWSVLGFLLPFVYIELIDKAVYLNHYYLVSLMLGLFAVLPAGRAYSVDVWLRRSSAIASIPNWLLYVLRLQVGIVYFYAGVAKLNSDWLSRAQPMRIWLGARSDLPVFGVWLAEPRLAYVSAFLGAAFDLSIVFLLLSRRTQYYAWWLLVAFHVATGVLFPIGIFPWLMTALATLCLAPTWPLSFLKRVFTYVAQAEPAWIAPKALPWLLGVHCAVQCLLPLRALSDPLQSAWTREGFNFAWKVMLTEKAGNVVFRVLDRATGETQYVEPETFLKPFQSAAMAQDPDLVRQAALHLAEGYRRLGKDVAVFADAVASLNGRPAQRLIEPDVDLSRPIRGRWITAFDPTP